MPEISKEENSEDFCLDFVQEFGLRREVGSKRKGWGVGRVRYYILTELTGGGGGGVWSRLFF